MAAAVRHKTACQFACHGGSQEDSLRSSAAAQFRLNGTCKQTGGIGTQTVAFSRSPAFLPMADPASSRAPLPPLQEEEVVPLCSAPSPRDQAPETL